MNQGSAQKPNIKAILFDKDGTLLDFNRTWLPPYEAAASYVAEQSKGKLTAAAILADGGYIVETRTWQPDSLLAAGSNGQIIERWSSLLDSPFTDDNIEAINQIFTLDPSAYIPVNEMVTILTQLKTQGYKLGIATMDDEHHAHSMVNGIKIKHLFDFICGADSGYGVKPEPGMVNAFTEAINLSPTEVAMVGDSPRDIHMGINAGAGLSIGVLTGAHNRQDLEKHTPYVLNSIADIAALLENTPKLNQ